MIFINEITISDIIELGLFLVTIITLFYTIKNNLKITNDNHKQNFRPYIKLSNLKFKVFHKSIYKFDLIGKNTDYKDKKLRAAKLLLELKNIGVGPAQNIFLYTPNSNIITDEMISQNFSIGPNEAIIFEVNLKYVKMKSDVTYVMLFFQDIFSNLYCIKFNIDIFFKESKTGISIKTSKIVDLNDRKIDKFLFKEILKDDSIVLEKYFKYLGKNYFKKIK